MGGFGEERLELSQRVNVVAGGDLMIEKERVGVYGIIQKTKNNKQ